MMNNYFNTIEITDQTESGIQIAKSKIIIPKATVSATNSGIIIPSSSLDLIETIADSKKINFVISNKVVTILIKINSFHSSHSLPDNM